MATKKPHRRSVAQTVHVVLRASDREIYLVGVCSTEELARLQVLREIQAALDVPQLRLPMWTRTPTGGQELVFYRDDRRFHYRMEPWPIDGEAH